MFCGVSLNSPYNNADFLHVLTDAAEHLDFINNTANRIDGPTGETVFSRLKYTNFEEIKLGFYEILTQIILIIKRRIRNRQIPLAFDITDDPYYGKVEGLWMHPYQPVRGSTGCFKYLTVSAVHYQNRLILGCLPVRIGYDIVDLVIELLTHVRQFFKPELLLFDRGFDNYRLVEALQKTGLRYQILWRKDTWVNKFLKLMKRNETKEVLSEKSYKYNKSTHKLNVRFVLIKNYKRHSKGKAYDWVFVTNTREQTKRCYVDRYKKRWGIETIFRVLDNIGIKTTTKNEIIRYFLVMFCCLLYNLWKCATTLGCFITLKNFIVKLVRVFTEKLLISKLDTG